jgi:hypothetical protein
VGPQLFGRYVVEMPPLISREGTRTKLTLHANYQII